MKDNNVKLTKRLCAYLIDVIFVSFVISLLIQIRFINPKYDEYAEYNAKYQDTVQEYYDGKISTSDFLNLEKEYSYNIVKYGIVYNVLIVVIILAYFVLFQKFNNGQTLGKKLMGIKLVGMDKNKLSLWQCLVRYLPISIVYVGNILVLILNSIFVFVFNPNNFYKANTTISMIISVATITSFIMVLVRKDKRGFHDLIGNTKVINDEVKSKVVKEEA